MKQNKTLMLVSLAMKAGKVASGEFSTEKVVKQGKAKLVMVSGEASDNTKKRFQDMCTYYQVPICFYGSKAELGSAIGKEFRASLAVVDVGLADAIKKSLCSTEEWR